MSPGAAAVLCYSNVQRVKPLIWRLAAKVQQKAEQAPDAATAERDKRIEFAVRLPHDHVRPE